MAIDEAVYEDGWAFGSVQGVQHCISGSLNELIVLRRSEVERLLESSSRNLQVHNIDRHKNVNRSRFHIALPQNTIDLLSSTLLAHQLSSSNTEINRSFVEDLMIRLRANGMVDHHLPLLHHPRRLADDVDHADLLGHGTRDAVEGRELAHAVRSNKTAGSMHCPSVAIGGVGGVELVGVADPFQAVDVVDVVEQSEVEVARDAEDAVDADLLYAGPEVEAERDGVGCAVCSVGCCVCHGWWTEGLVSSTMCYRRSM